MDIKEQMFVSANATIERGIINLNVAHFHEHLWMIKLFCISICKIISIQFIVSYITGLHKSDDIGCSNDTLTHLRYIYYKLFVSSIHKSNLNKRIILSYIYLLLGYLLKFI